MRSGFLITFLLILIPGLVIGQNKGDSFNKGLFYSAISSNNVEQLDRQVIILEGTTIREKEAFSGALLMKKAGFEKTPKEKMVLFKSGNQKLEKAIKTDSLNAEYRFLRLVIQENAPGMLKYNKNIEEDKGFIVNSFQSLPTAVQTAIKNYSKQSKHLISSELQ